MRHFKTISEFHEFRGLPWPQHPLISLIEVEHVKHLHTEEPTSLVFDFYGIAVKRVAGLKVRYGQQPFDFNEGVLSFMAPDHVISIGLADKHEEIKRSAG